MRLDNRRAVRHRSQYHLLDRLRLCAGARSAALAVAAGKQQQRPVIEALGANRQAFSLRTAAELLRMPRFWGFIVYVVGVASVYDVFDQQFANFFKSFFASPQRGTEVFGFVTTGGELLNALIMFCAPAIVNRIGAKNALLTAGMIMSVRILGSSFASSAVEVVILKMLHMFEIPFLLVGTFKYISSAFNPRLSATLFLIGFNLSKQLSGVVLSAWWAGCTTPSASIRPI